MKHIYIPTYRRPNAQHTLKLLPPHLLKKTLLVVRRDEQHLYSHPTLVLPETVTNLGQTRQFIHEHAGVSRHWVLDDDIMDIKPRTYHAGTDHLWRLGDLDWGKLEADIEDALNEAPVVGLANSNTIADPTRLPGKFNTKVTVFYALDGSKLQDLRWDTTLNLADIDFTMTALRRGLRNYRFENYKVFVGKDAAPGGCQTYRTSENYEQVILQLAQKHHPFIKVRRTKAGRTAEAEYGELGKVALTCYWDRAYKSAMREAEEDHLAAMDRLMGESHWLARGAP